ncbi:hypothetical protein SEEN2570_08474 [Salmonella enterica subsp. enterica serovar Newport str. VA_R100512570]|nr:hypothetical protein SEEN593_04934 [Salmonella enterica subsp. enterica serovar Newport str. CVM 19593]ESC40505.1 hypothetical protein SEENP079_08285 [Salmonella enterica subsp. enterica serovar Newport str. RI_10P079]ESC45397.1 hypothetical protein SEENP078_18263 [Salmonella enterica subsp. enterica serovar Newport str. RI_10P078]ESC47455.1 hypothetical protein SEENP069_16815 [Salmonella enterica subsp. enterica serovar Newport str. RI_10P069]ESC68828.1 hypothetical protein SEEN4900_11166 [
MYAFCEFIEDDFACAWQTFNISLVINEFDEHRHFLFTGWMTSI